MNTKLLRQKVLDLAIHGKLVPQNPEHESASVLLERIRGESLPLSPDGKPSSATPSAGSNAARNARSNPISEDEIPFEIPENWCWCRIGELTETTDYIANGSFADTRENVKFYKEENYALLVKTQDFNNNFTDDLTYTDKQGYDFLKKSQLFGGELLLSNIGASIGKALIVPNFNRPMAVAPNSIIVRPCSIYNTQLLRAVMLSSYGQNALIEFTGGSAMPKFNKTQLRSLCVPLPPLEEQKLIVEEIERIFALIDTVEQNKTDLETVIKQTKSKILDLAIHGKLVPQDKADEPASKMLEKLRAEKEEKIAKGELKRDKNDSYIYRADDGKWVERKADGSEEEIEVPFEVPEGWCWCRLGELGYTNIGLTYHPEDITNDGVPVLRSCNIKNNALDFENTVRVNTKILPNQYVQDGDILICARNGSQALVGKCTIISELKEPMSFGAFMAIFRSEMNPYILRYLQSIYFKDYMLDANSTQICQLTQSMLKNALIPVPPINEQKRIINIIDIVFLNLSKVL